METIARYLIIAGVILILIGGGICLAARLGIPFGRLPGDVLVEGRNGSFYFPLASSVIISIILSILLSLFFKFWGEQ